MAKSETNNKQSVKKLYLSKDDKKILGVCGGIAEYFEVDSTLVRVAWILVSVATGGFPGVIGYFIAGMVMPNRPE